MSEHLLLIDASGLPAMPEGARALYQLEFPNGKRYFGITNKPKRRRQRHKDQACRGSDYPVHRAMRHYGFANVTMRIIAVGPADYIAQLEDLAVIAFESRNPDKGYNVMPGGQRNPMEVEEVAKRVGRMLLGRKDPPEVREKKRARWTAEEREKVGAQHRGKRISESHLAAIRAWNQSHRDASGRWTK